MQQEIRFVESYHMPDRVHMLSQNFWVVVDVVFTVGEVEKSIPATLESGMSGSIYIQYPMIKDGESRIIFKRMKLGTYVVILLVLMDITHRRCRLNAKEDNDNMSASLSLQMLDSGYSMLDNNLILTISNC